MGALESFLAIIGFLAKSEPAIEAFITHLLEGDPTAVERLAKVLPKQSATGAQARQWAADKAAREAAERGE